MQYFKNTDLARLYPISEKAVRNWIKAAQGGQLDLVLHETTKRAYIANTPQNIAKIEKIVEERKKYSNKLTHREVYPASEFYETYQEEHIFDIINSLEVHREIPLQYSYFGKGAKIWEEYILQQLREEVSSIPSASSELFLLNQRYFEYLIKPYKRLNIVCIGAEIFSTLKPILKYLENKKSVGRIILIDTSESLLNIAQKRLEEWFDGSLELETVKRDMRYERFHDLLLRDTLRRDADETLNMFFLVGSTIYNFQSPSETLKMIHHSLGSRDVFIHDIGLDSEDKRGFNLSFGLSSNLSPKLSLMLSLMGIDESFYEVERFYDKEQKQRMIQIRLNISITLKMKFANGDRTLRLNKGERVTVFRYWHQSTEDTLRKLDEAGFDLMHASHTKDNRYLMTISSIGKRH